MSLQNALDVALKGVPGCNVVSYIDLESGLVLRKAVSSPVAQEILDRCASMASALWSGPDLSKFAGQAMGQLVPSDGIYLLQGRRQSYVFARSPKYEEHAICFRCEIANDPQETVDAAKRAIQVVASGY